MTKTKGHSLRFARHMLLVALLGGLQGCAALQSLEAPSVSITSLRAVDSDGMVPNFVIGLRVVNPNAIPLPIQGISYSIDLNGTELIRGVGNDFPEIESYGQADLSITASADLLAGVRLIADLLRSQNDTVRYDVEARLDLGGLRPDIRVRDDGSLSLSDLR